ncbi:uncharacterized protein LOC62_03G004280 [Vanrija pseudolonga]|uniref:CUE domain-containing protein n=1 Tax=Vanrija pseudolonga TaxID=143232 RepID=A0AAF0YB38_9TREE|nr:hypothetical protein LOC62_03G004280 [Vanrija pseudolonga]
MSTSPKPTSPTSPKVTEPVASPTAPVTEATADLLAEATADTVAKPADTTTTPAAAPAAPAAAPPAPAHANPKVNELAVMFPTVDTGVIEMVLESVGGSQDRAIESLLQMTDPEFKPDTSAQPVSEDHPQVDLDEEFARALHLQDQEDDARRRAARAPRGHPGDRTQQQSQIPEVLPYQPRVRRARPPGPDPYATSTQVDHLQQRYDASSGPIPGGQQPGAVAFEEKLNHFAETGKATVSSFFNKAKARYNEFQQTREENRVSQQEAAAGWNNHASVDLPQQGYGQQQQYGYAAPSGPPPTGERPGANQRTISQSSGSTGGSAAPVASAPRSSSRRWSPTDTYDDDAVPLSQGNTINVGGRQSPAAGGATSPDRGAAGKIDLAKLGFLPKKRVDLSTLDKDPNPSLQNATSPASPPATGKSLVEKIPKTPTEEVSPHQLGDDDDDDEELEYTKNPFDEK